MSRFSSFVRHIRIPAALLAVASVALPVEAQQERGISSAAASRLDVAVYVGGSASTAWLEGKGYDVGVGYNPAFGASLGGWFSPQLGVRLHGSYVPSGLPHAAGLDSILNGGRPLNLWLYDVELTARPFATRGDLSRQLRSVYAWIGGGGITVDLAGEAEGCLFPWNLGGACLPYDPGAATVGQLTAGTGMNLFYLTENFAAYGELGIHAYDSPFHTEGVRIGSGDACDVDCSGRDRFVVTPRLVIGTKLGLGSSRPRAAAPAPLAVPTAPPPLAPRPPLSRPIQVCVVEGGIPRYVSATYRVETGDTVVLRSGIERPFRAVYPIRATGAAERSWYINDEDIFWSGRPYVKFGLARSIEQPDMLVRTGEYEGIPLFGMATERGDEGPPMLYVPVGDGCQFQPYQAGDWVRRVRG